MSYFDTLKDELNSNDLFCRENGMEGDDWCYHWSRYLNEQGTNVIIWTKDKDLTQLVKMNNDRYFTIGWNEDSGIISCEMPEEDLSFLFNAQFIANDTLFQSLIDKAGKITTINPKEIVIDKILRGDSSDNIQPIVLRFSKNNLVFPPFLFSTVIECL